MHYGIKPDILTSAKALGNGMPIGACLMSGPACNVLQPGKHGSTFGGNPLACHTALTVLDIIDSEQLSENAQVMGDNLRHALIGKLCTMPEVRGVRGQGLMIGVELDRPCRDILPIALEEGLLFSVTAENVLRILPPLTIKEEDIEIIADKLSTIIERYYG